MKYEEAIQRVEKFAELPENWDSYGSREIDPFCIARAKLLLQQWSHIDVIHVAPTSSGGVHVEWDGAPYMITDVESEDPNSTEGLVA